MLLELTVNVLIVDETNVNISASIDVYVTPVSVD